MSLSARDITRSDGYKATYAASWASFTPIAALTFSMPGSTTKLVKILRLGISGTQTTAGTVNVFLNTVASITGGTTVAPTGIVAFDSTSPAATAAPVIYSVTATATTGTLICKEIKLVVPTATGITAAQTEYIFDFTNPYNQGLTLNGTSEIAIINVATAPAGIAMSMWVEWTEE